MHVKQFTAAVDELFGEWLTQFPEGDEYAFYHYGPDHFRTIGYATNMSPEVVQQAAEQQVDLIITHLSNRTAMLRSFSWRKRILNNSRYCYLPAIF